MPDFEYKLPGSARSKKSRRKFTEARAFQTRLGRELKEVYTVERRIYESQRDGSPSTYRPAGKLEGRPPITIEDKATVNLWDEITRKLYQKRIDPIDYVRRIFATLGGSMITCPRPNQLLSSACLQRYKDSTENLREEIQMAFEVQRVSARREVIVKCQINGYTANDAISWVLREESLPLSALFRFCLAISMDKDSGLVKLAERFRKNAAIQYFPTRVEYDQVWGEYIPDPFRQEAVSIYEGIARRMS